MVLSQVSYPIVGRQWLGHKMSLRLLPLREETGHQLNIPSTTSPCDLGSPYLVFIKVLLSDERYSEQGGLDHGIHLGDGTIKKNQEELKNPRRQCVQRG